MSGDIRDYIEKFDHVGIAVRSIAEALTLYRDLLGGEYLIGGDVPEQGYRWLQLVFPGGGKIELIQPLTDEGFLAEFLRRRGEGLHHLTFKVRHIEEVVEWLKAAGWRVVGESYGDPTWKEAFISPRHAHGTVIQLAESCLTEEEEIERWRPPLEELLTWSDKGQP